MARATRESVERDGFVVVASRGTFEARVSSRDSSNYQVFVGPVNEDKVLTRQERCELSALAFEIHEAFRGKLGVPSTECRFYDCGTGEPYNVGAVVKCYGARREYLPGVVLEYECRGFDRPWTEEGIAAMTRFLESTQPMFLLGLEDYEGRLRVVLKSSGSGAKESA